MKEFMKALEQKIEAVAGSAKVTMTDDGKVSIKLDWCPVPITVKPSTRVTLKGWVNGTYKKFLTAYFKNREVQGYMSQAAEALHDPFSGKEEPSRTVYTGPLFDSTSAPF